MELKPQAVLPGPAWAIWSLHYRLGAGDRGGLGRPNFQALGEVLVSGEGVRQQEGVNSSQIRSQARESATHCLKGHRLASLLLESDCPAAWARQGK